MPAADPPDDPFSTAEDGSTLDEYQRSRTSLKKERVNNEQALRDLAERLLGYPRAQLAALGLPDDAIESLEALHRIKSFAARERQLRLVRAKLRAMDWMSLRVALDHRRAGYVESPRPSSDEARVWTEQLLIQKDEGLSRFVQTYERASRNRLRQLVRNVNAAGEAKRHRARQLLLHAVQEVLDLAARDASHSEED